MSFSNQVFDIRKFIKIYRLLVSKKVISKTQDYDRANLLSAKLLCKYSWVTKIISFSLETNGYSRVKTKNSH